MNLFKFWLSLLIPFSSHIVELDGAGSDMPIAPEEPTENAGEEVAAEAPVENQYQFNPDNYGVIFRSENVVPKDEAHLKELLQMGHSYNANKDKWNTLETENQKLQQQWQQYDQLNNTLVQHPELATQMDAVFKQYMQGQQQPQNGQQLDPVMTQRLEALEQQREDDRLAQDMNKVMDAHKEHDWNKDTGEGSLRIQLLKFMDKNRINDPEFAYRAMMFPTATEKAKFDAAKQTTNAIRNQHKAGIVAQGTASPPATGGWNPKGKSYDQAEEAGLAMLAQRK